MFWRARIRSCQLLQNVLGLFPILLSPLRASWVPVRRAADDKEAIACGTGGLTGKIRRNTV